MNAAHPTSYLLKFHRFTRPVILERDMGLVLRAGVRANLFFALDFPVATLLKNEETDDE
ncbi:MAG: hypothetical protein AAB425_13210 [Bdellovibrionota bacterium]